MPNFDEKTGIHYGCIHQNSLAMEAIEDWYDKDRIYDGAIEDLKEKIRDVLDAANMNDKTFRESLTNTLLDSFIEGWQNDSPNIISMTRHTPESTRHH